MTMVYHSHFFLHKADLSAGFKVLKGNVLLRKKQYQLSDDASWSLHVVRLMIGGKIQNYAVYWEIFVIMVRMKTLIGRCKYWNVPSVML